MVLIYRGSSNIHMAAPKDEHRPCPPKAVEVKARPPACDSCEYVGSFGEIFSRLDLVLSICRTRGKGGTGRAASSSGIASIRRLPSRYLSRLPCQAMIYHRITHRLEVKRKAEAIRCPVETRGRRCGPGFYCRSSLSYSEDSSRGG